MPLWKTAHGWRYQFQRNGERHSGSGFKTKKEAASEQAAHKKRIEKEEKIPIATDFRTVANDYLDFAERAFVSKTFKQKRFVLKSFLKHTGNLPIDHITASHLHSYLNTRPTNNNYNAHRKDLCSLFTHARRVMKVIAYNPCWDLDKMPHTPGEKQIPSEKELMQMLLVTDPKTDERALFLVVLHCLGRIDEVLRMQWKDVNFEKKTVTLWTRKRKGGAFESDHLPMNKDLYDILWRLWECRQQETWVFYNAKTETRYNHRPKMMKSICMRAFDPKCKGQKYYTGKVYGFHALRHFMASYLADKKKQSAKTLQGLLRHKNVKTTEIYLHTIEGQAVEAVESVEGVFTVDAKAEDKSPEILSRSVE